MSEIKRLPHTNTDVNGDEVYTFDVDHTFSDVARWIIQQGGAEEVTYFLTDGKEALYE